MICLMNIMYMCDELAWSVPACFAELRNFRNAFRHGRWSCWNPWFMIPKIVFCAWFLGSSLLHWPFQEEFGKSFLVTTNKVTKWIFSLVPGLSHSCRRQFANTQNFHESDTVRVSFLRMPGRVRSALSWSWRCALPSSILHRQRLNEGNSNIMCFHI